MYKKLFFLFLVFILMSPSYAINGYENSSISNSNIKTFCEDVILRINQERSLRGLSNLHPDLISTKTAFEHANYLLRKGSLSYYNLKKQCPDERFSSLGGQGAIYEIIKGFEKDLNEEKIILDTTLSRQLIEALIINSDDSKILFNPFLTNIGVFAITSQDFRKFIIVIELVNSKGKFTSLPESVYLGQKVNISGNILQPYKFKAVSVAYFDGNIYSEDNFNTSYIDNDSLQVYFPPEDFIAYTDTTSRTVLNILKGIGLVGSIAASPFTGGASTLLAPFFIQSIQGFAPKEIPVKSGINLQSNGSFTGSIDLNYQGMTGLYSVSILGELEGVKYPIVAARKTIRVIYPGSMI